MNSLVSSRSIGDPVSQFQTLTRRVSKTPSKVRIHEKPKMSPREEIYKSMIREIRKGDVAQMNSLVHKASGILRLAHYKEVNKSRKVTVSWDIDGRRVLTYEDKSGAETSALQRQTNFDRKAKKSLLASLSEPIFGLDSHNLKVLSEHFNNTKDDIMNHNGAADGELPKNKVSKVWEDYIETGDVSKLWQSKEGIFSADENPLSSSLSSSSNSGRKHSATSVSGNRSLATTEGEDRPPWKECYKAPSSNYIVSSRDRAHSISTLPSIASSNRTNKSKKSSKQSSRTQSSMVIQEKETEKVERIQHICVVNGSVVSFKNFGFENFTNWFGDESTLEANQQRSQPKIHLELDLTNVKSRDIKIRLLDGFKLEVEARRRMPGTSKPIRVKEILLIPEGYRAEDLLMCRLKTGKLVVEEITPEHIPVKTDNSKQKSSKSKEKWKLSRK